MAIINVLVAVFVRNPFVLRTIYEIETKFVKLCLKIPGERFYYLVIFQLNRALHNIGGIHTGSAIFVIVWSIIYLIMLPIQYSHGLIRISVLRLIALEITAALLLFFVLIMCIFATPYLRGAHHNLFELTHRFCGWSATGVLIAHASIAQETWFPFSTSFALALAIAMFVFYPWFLLRRTDAKILNVNSRSIALAFEPKLVTSVPGTFIRFSFSPLKEWHAFAVSGPVPESIRTTTQNKTLTSIIARAGDWTGKLIESENSKVDLESGNTFEVGSSLSKKLWIRFHTPPGFMFSARGYSEILFVATGAGIAPILSYLHPGTEEGLIKNVLWIGNRPEETFGIFAEVVFGVSNLIVHDTSKNGRPVVDKLCCEIVRGLPNCQAVFIVANQPVTRAVQQALFFVNIPCYGAEWDS